MDWDQDRYYYLLIKNMENINDFFHPRLYTIFQKTIGIYYYECHL